MGFGALTSLSLFHIFICLRLVEVPQLIERDVPNATFLAKIFLLSRSYFFYAVLSMWSWYGACAIQLQNVFLNVLSVVTPDMEQHADDFEDLDTPFGWKIVGTILLAIVIVPLSLKTSAKDLQTKASYAVYSMLAIGIIEMTCASIHGIATWFSDQPNDYCMVGKQIPQGLYDMGMAFGGIAIWPYVLADMLNPGNAKIVVVKATTRIMFFYLFVAMIGYFGWARTIEKRTPLQQMMEMSLWYQNAARIISALFVLKILGLMIGRSGMCWLNHILTVLLLLLPLLPLPTTTFTSTTTATSTTTPASVAGNTTTTTTTTTTATATATATAATTTTTITSSSATLLMLRYEKAVEA